MPEFSANNPQETKSSQLEEEKSRAASDIEKLCTDFLSRTHHPDASFHNFDHLNNVNQVGQRLLQAAQYGRDPLRLWDDLEQYLKQTKLEDHYFRNQDLEIAFFSFALVHDLGNMFESFQFTDGSVTTTPNHDPDGFNVYLKNGAEERSQSFTHSFIAHYFSDQFVGDPDRLDQVVALTNYFIDLTKFRPTPTEQPFGRLIAALDQSLAVSNFSSAEDFYRSQIGLLNEEQYDPQGLKQINVDNFIAFPVTRLKVFYPDPSTRSLIFKIVGDFPNFVESPSQEHIDNMRHHPIFASGRALHS